MAVDFSWTPEEEALRDMLQDFAHTVLKPDYQLWDESGEFPMRHWQELGRLGVLGASMPERYGGGGLSSIAAGVAVEEISRADFNLGYAIVLNGLIGDILMRHASEPLRQTLLPLMFRGTSLACIGVTEPQGGSDVQAIRASISYRTDQQLELNGEKSGISLAMIADRALVAAREESGISLFALPLERGVRRVAVNDMGNRPIKRGSLFFDHVPLTDAERVGSAGAGLKAVLAGFDFSRTLIALQCLGAAMESLDETIDYVNQRRAFGRRLSEFEAVSFNLAERFAEIEQLRWFCYRTLWLRDRDRAYATEAAICKWRAPQVALATIHDCLILHGQTGYSRDLPLQQRWRDVMGLEIGDGTANVQKMIVGRSLTGVRAY